MFNKPNARGKPAHQEGAKARKNFEDTMQKLFRVPKAEVSKPKPEPKKESEK